MFWIKAYQRAGLKNKLENITISNVQFVALDMDKFYESITVRIYASSLDYVEDSAGRVKGGSSKELVLLVNTGPLLEEPVLKKMFMIFLLVQTAGHLPIKWAKQVCANIAVQKFLMEISLGY
jgi:hypothetical protein